MKKTSEVNLAIEKKYSISKKQAIMFFGSMIALFAMICLLAFLFFMLGGNTNTGTALCYLGIVALAVIAFGVFLFHGNIKVIQQSKKLIALCVIMIINFAVFSVVHLYISPYAVPYAFCALIIGTVISRKTGFFASLVVIFSLFFAQSFFRDYNAEANFIPLVVGVFTSIIAAFAYSKQNTRLHYLVVFAYLSAVTIASSLFLSAAFSPDAFREAWLLIIGFSFLGSFFSIAAYLLFMPILDTVFNFVSDFRLQDLASTNNPLMKKLFDEAPGTFNHSLTVANYAEACASAIGENTFMARACAYYHDIGKLKNPSYFSENQLDDVNPHDEITPELSVSIIKKHVPNGVTLAKEHHLPKEIQRAISEHHGTMPIRYFYDKARKYSELDLNVSEFCYDGPKPTSKISAILMICDACEATLRASESDNRQSPAQYIDSLIKDRFRFDDSMRQHAEELFGMIQEKIDPEVLKDRFSAKNIVDAIVVDRMRNNQFSECDITMKDLEIIKNTIVSVFGGINHERVKYPKEKIEKNEG